jgi:branched-chain amino acid transport system permease protein
VFYREAGQYKTTYQADMSIFPILQDRIGLTLIIALALLLPFFTGDFMIASVMVPFLILSLGAIGLNILTGYTGLVSLGSGAFMGVGAYACYKLSTAFPAINILVWIVASGFVSCAVGVLFGLPSLRIKGFYLAVATLAAQFFLQWCFVRVPWLYNYNPSGAIEVPSRTLFGIHVTGASATPTTRYYIALAIVIGVTWIVSNLVHGRVGRSFMAVRDMDIAAQLIGIRLLRTKLLAFAVSSFITGVAGAMMVFLWLGAAEPEAFNINQSFILLFMVIIGGLGSLIGLTIGAATVEHLTYMITGALIIFFLIVEPLGLARLWQIGKQKLRVWPFPY